MQNVHHMRRGFNAQLLSRIFLVSFLIGIPAAAAPPERLSGVWVGSIALDGLTRPLVLQLEERTNGRLIGYVLGRSGEATVASGSTLHKELSAQLEITTASAMHQVSLAGRLKGRNLIQASATVAGSSQPVTFSRVEGNIKERRFWVAVLPDGGDFIVNEVVALVGDGGDFVAGAFVGQQTCALWSCEGRLDSFAETAAGNTLDFTFHSSDPCSAGSSAHLDFDARTLTYSGSFVLRTCTGPSTTGFLLGVKQPGTQSSDVAQILTRLANLADDFETPAPFPSTHDSFSGSYLDWGMNLAALLNRYSQEKTKYSSIEASFGRIADITTMIDPGTWPEFQRPFGARFVERRSGVPAGGAPRVTYVDSDNIPDRALLRLWSKEPRGWVIRGNDSDALDFPFEYSMTPDGLAFPSDGVADHVKVSLGPFGTHFAHATGHAIGDGTAKLVGFFTASDGDLDPIASGFAFYGGGGGAVLLARRPLYRAPAAGFLTTIACFPSGDIYLNHQPNWQIEIRLPNGEKLGLGHVGEFHTGLRETVWSATGIDIRALTCPLDDMGRNVLGSDAAIPIARHAALGWPQVVATPVSGHDGYYVGGGGFPDRPWAQMEFFFDAEDSSTLPGDFSADCFYNYLDWALAERLQSAMQADMTNPGSQRYRSFQGPDWRWRMNAESRLCMAPSAEPRDFRDLYTKLGGWYERDVPSPMDEIVGFAPIAKDTDLYDPSDYFSPTTSMLLARRKKNPLSFSWNLPDRGVVPVPYPDGEIVERTADTLLIHWRNLFPGSPTLRQDYWQRATYSLDATGLRIRWGAFALDSAGAFSPGPATDVPCNGFSVVCYDHQVHNFPGF